MSLENIDHLTKRSILQIFIETSTEVNAIVIRTYKVARNKTFIELLLFETGTVWADCILKLFCKDSCSLFQE